jgi:hypothetical protein
MSSAGKDGAIGKFGECFRDRGFDDAPGAGDAGFFMNEGGDPIGQAQQPGSHFRQQGDPSRFDALRLEKILAPDGGFHLGEIGLGPGEPCPLAAEIGSPLFGARNLVAQVSDIAANAAHEFILAAFGLGNHALTAELLHPPLGSGAR